MAIAAIAHAYVFNVEPYQHIPLLDHGKVRCEESKMEVKVDVNDDRISTPAAVKRKDTHVEAPGTSIKESVQDVVLVGGQHVIDCHIKFLVCWQLNSSCVADDNWHFV